MQTLTDEELIQAAQTGHTEGFTLLVRRYEQRLFRSMTRISGSPEDAEDICQEAFTRAWRAISKFRGESQFYSWVFRIALNLLRSSKRQLKASVSLDAVRDAIGDDLEDQRADVDPSHSLQVRDQQRVVQEAMDAMEESFRTVLVLTDLEEMSYEEIARVVDCPVGTVRSRIHRARQEFRGRMERLLRQEQRAC
ncbi:RNA polymerase sigma factor, sigma-70 family [Planctopirus limnophila DSM 3776]|uniref:RNA polymerase sigma factor, sigma-70 family n=1 Tax=Planctopirus limnophila (strain ATCC 43296 / DSM 3776 / IFAM 1008 / Mu 290) TaxID=521674 RepID=D5SNG4_PLAL2|nr:sigma-70 family RNA polymerase sigma factor [Planctopirus limnophila]ADG68078.1 RNA polymerase sigma factor, sigma-70 family [Planctopirus limnophila DSM 3776]